MLGKSLEMLGKGEGAGGSCVKVTSRKLGFAGHVRGMRNMDLVLSKRLFFSAIDMGVCLPGVSSGWTLETNPVTLYFTLEDKFII